jgi:hypothetical protein
MHKLVADAIAAGADTFDHDTLASQVQLYRSAPQIGLSTTAARSTKVMRKHNALARRLLDWQTTTCASPAAGESNLITTAPSATSACPSCGRRCPGACAPSPEPGQRSVG